MEAKNDSFKAVVGNVLNQHRNPDSFTANLGYVCSVALSAREKYRIFFISSFINSLYMYLVSISTEHERLGAGKFMKIINQSLSAQGSSK